MKVSKLFLVILIIFTFFTKCIFAQDSSGKCEPKASGMILESSGDVKYHYKKENGKIRLMMPVYENMTIATGKNGKVVYVRYSDNKEYSVQPNSKVIIGKKRDVLQKGKIAKNTELASALPLPANTEVKSRKILGYISRMVATDGLNLISPLYNEVLSEPKLDIKWVYKDADKIRINIKEKANGKTDKPFPLLLNNTGSYSFSNSPEFPFKLEYGKEYLLTINPEIAQGKEKTDNLDLLCEYEVIFSILSENDTKNVSRVEAKFSEIMKKDKNNKKALLQMADFYNKYKIYQKSISLVKQIKELDPKNPYPCFFLGETYEKMGEPELSVKYFEEGLKLERESKK